MACDRRCLVDVDVSGISDMTPQLLRAAVKTMKDF